MKYASYVPTDLPGYLVLCQGFISFFYPMNNHQHIESTVSNLATLSAISPIVHLDLPSGGSEQAR